MKSMTALLVLCVMVCVFVTPAVGQVAPDTLYGQFLFSNGAEVFVKCPYNGRLNDSVAAADFGPVIEARAPIWRFKSSDSSVHYIMGDSVQILRYVLPRRALDMNVRTNRALWDPVAAGYEVPYVGMGLVHRWLFRLTPDGEIRPDLARSWLWQGHDLFVVLDSTQTFGDGTPIDAYHVKSSLERYFWYFRDTASVSWHRSVAGVENYRSGKLNHVVGLIPRHRDTLQISLSRPNYELPARLAAPRTAIVKWSRTESAAPVVATAGHFSVRVGRTLKGRPPHRGAMVVDERGGPGIRVLETGHPEDMGPACVATPIPAPDMVVLRFAPDLDASTKTFLDHGIDRNAIQGLGFDHMYYDGSAFPVCDTSNVRGSGWRFDLAIAEKARDQVSDERVLQLYWQKELSDIGEYLLTFLKAWNVRAEHHTNPATAHVSVERWVFESFADDAVVERVLQELHLGSDHSLTKQLTLARATDDTGVRTAAYGSIKSRIEDQRPFIGLFQQDARFDHCFSRPVEYDFDYLLRPGGPLFTKRGQP